jgi:arginyl-tRNA synthetase
MYAWMQFGNGETPESAGLKGDHLVGKYYVIFDKHYKQEIETLIAEGLTKEEAEKKAPSIMAAQQLLQKWEANDEETVNIWKTMNGWVYQGFDVTYKKLGVQFDKFYYESNTYILGKDIVQQGLTSGAFFKKDDGSVWIDLIADGLDQKLLLRGDGTSVYITQDIGTAELKYKDFDCERSVYVVGNEQDYHFKVLQLICKRLHKPFADGIYHLSYGMVELPHGKMKSREGTVVDADDLIDEMITTATETTKALGKTDGIPEAELQNLFETIGMGALKYYLLKVDPKKKMMFNPEESIDFQGNTGPFIQYTHARIKSILRNAGSIDYTNFDFSKTNITEPERKLVFTIYQYPQAIADAGKDMSPGIICNYAYDLAKAFNHFYHECSVLKEENESQRNFRIQLVNLTAHILKSSFGLLGINVPEKM